MPGFGALFRQLGQAHVVFPVHDAPVGRGDEQVLLGCGLDAPDGNELLDELLILVFFDDLRVVVRVSVHGKAIAYAQ